MTKLRMFGLLCLWMSAACARDDAGPAEHEELAETSQALRASLFSDEFESTFLSSRWAVTGLTGTSALAAYQGSLGAKVYGTSSMTVTVDTRGQTDVTVEYARRAIGLTGSEALIVDWSPDGSSWQVLESTQDPSFRKKLFALGDGASNRAAVRIRFRSTAAFLWTGGDLDSVVIGAQQATPAAQQTTLVLVRNNDAGNSVLQYVRGATHFTQGSYVSAPQPLPFARLTNFARRAIQTPNALLDAASGQILVARLTLDGSSARIQLARARYDSMLAEATVQDIATRAGGVVTSRVSLAHLGSAIAALWVEGGALNLVRSTDGGASWGGVEVFSGLPIAEEFAISERSNGEILLARELSTASGRRVEVDSLRSNRTFSVVGDVVTVPNDLVGLSVAEHEGHLYVAYAGAAFLRVTKWFNFSSVVTGTSTVTNLSGSTTFHAVSIHPSPFGWGLQYLYSYDSAQGRRFGTIGRRSDDGLFYPTNAWDYSGAETANNGPTDMSLTPVPMPWIIKTHDSGASKDAVANIFIVGEGFTYEDRDQFLRAAEILTTNIESRTPFRFNPQRYNVWAIAGYSKERYYDDSSDWGARNTLFDSNRTTGSIVVPGHAASTYARRILHGYNGTGTAPKRTSGFIMINTPPNKEIGITPNDPGVPLSPHRVHELVPIHEYLHTGNSGFALGDHELHNQGQAANKSFDGRLQQSASPPHAWQGWFSFGGRAPSRLIQVTPAYRAAPNSEQPFSNSPSSPSYVSALDLFNVGLWESWDPFGWDFNSGTRQYQALLSCAMNSRYYHNEELCPICAETIVSKLMSDQNQTFDRNAYQGGSGAWLELYGRNPGGCGNSDSDKELNLEGLVQINGSVLGAAAFEKPERNGKQIGAAGSVVRVNLTPHVTRNSTATVTFRVRASSDPERRLYLPGVQVVNGQGARYSVQPQSAALASALAAKAYGQDCAYFYWDLSAGAEGQLSLTFVPR